VFRKTGLSDPVGDLQIRLADILEELREIRIDGRCFLEKQLLEHRPVNCDDLLEMNSIEFHEMLAPNVRRC